MKGGKCCGSGVYYYNISGRYESDWVDGKYDGFGVETWSKGSMYRDGFRNGFGVYRFYTADVYAGQWFNGQKFNGTWILCCVPVKRNISKRPRCNYFFTGSCDKEKE
ncbi:unnamed protein product [Trifolium pratense]|uniref:Uncharacterized protein n=1 Tax=Trifolium pratense TaxID=57577 RepID=A0ACB0IWS1_TRIPR|nr:unnamed protein product [Trifolium pratense]